MSAEWVGLFLTIVGATAIGAWRLFVFGGVIRGEKAAIEKENADLRAKLLDLSNRHAFLAEESRSGQRSLLEKTALLEKDVASLRQENALVNQELKHLSEGLASKASVESVEAVRETLGRIEGAQTQIAAQLNLLVQRGIGGLSHVS